MSENNQGLSKAEIGARLVETRKIKNEKQAVVKKLETGVAPPTHGAPPAGAFPQWQQQGRGRWQGGRGRQGWRRVLRHQERGRMHREQLGLCVALERF